MGEPVSTATMLYVAAATTATNVGMQRVAAKKQERAAQTAQNAQIGADRTTREEAQRQSRIRRARILQAGENQGTEGSSQESGAVGSAATVSAAAAGKQKGQQLANIAIGNQMQSAADTTSLANAFSAVSSLAMQGAQMRIDQKALPDTTTNVVPTE